LDPIISRELVLIKQLIHEEIVRESARRGCPVSAGDPQVRETVCAEILRIGAAMREACAKAA
jgi:hypothetical protein